MNVKWGGRPEYSPAPPAPRTPQFRPLTRSEICTARSKLRPSQAGYNVQSRFVTATKLQQPIIVSSSVPWLNRRCPVDYFADEDWAIDDWAIDDRDKFGSTTAGKLAKLRRTQSMPTSLFSLIFGGTSG
jgi:hypothetical protein